MAENHGGPPRSDGSDSPTGTTIDRGKFIVALFFIILGTVIYFGLAYFHSEYKSLSNAIIEFTTALITNTIPIAAAFMLWYWVLRPAGLDQLEQARSRMIHEFDQVLVKQLA